MVDEDAVQLRPTLFTTLVFVVGPSVIFADPIFYGLAISMVAGEIASFSISEWPCRSHMT
jgi:hypothetical protein